MKNAPVGGGLMRIPGNALFGILMVISAYPEVRPAHTAFAGMFQLAYWRLCAQNSAHMTLGMHFDGKQWLCVGVGMTIC